MTATPETTLRAALAGHHARWLEEVRDAIVPAQGPDATAWSRWSAIRYMEGMLRDRVARERLLVESVGPKLSEGDRNYLWALGELLEVLPAYAGHLVGLCHRAEAFTDVTTRTVRALQRWCAAVEDTVGALPPEAVPPGAGAWLEEGEGAEAAGATGAIAAARP